VTHASIALYAIRERRRAKRTNRKKRSQTGRQTGCLATGLFPMKRFYRRDHASRSMEPFMESVAREEAFHASREMILVTILDGSLDGS